MGTETLRERFEGKWTPVPEAGCWLWLGNVRVNRGVERGIIRADENKKRFAHRISWQLHRGDIPAGQLVCHKCDTPLCVNPDHLFLGTIADNTHDMIRKGRDRHPRGEGHPCAKLRDSDVHQIRRLRANGTKRSDLSKAYGITVHSIDAIVSRKTWRHV